MPGRFFLIRKGRFDLDHMAYHLNKKRGRPLTVSMTNNTGPLLWIARQKGFLHECGIEIDIRFVHYSAKNVELLLKDQIDIVAIVETNVAYLGFINSKFPVKCFASMLGRYTDEILLRQKNARPGDVRGKTIGFMPRTSSHTYLRKFLDRHEIRKSEITLKAGNPQTLPDMLVRGDIDAISCWKPYTLYARYGMNELGIEYTVFENKALNKDKVVLAAKKSFLIRNEEKIRRMLYALRKAEHFCFEYPDEAIALCAQKMKVPASELEKYWDNFDPRLEPVGTDFVENVKFLGEWIRQEDTRYKGWALPDYEDYMDNKLFLDFFAEKP